MSKRRFRNRHLHARWRLAVWAMVAACAGFGASTAQASAISSSWASIDWEHAQVTLTSDAGSSLAYSVAPASAGSWQYGGVRYNDSSAVVIAEYNVSPAVAPSAVAGLGPSLTYAASSDATQPVLRSASELALTGAGSFSAYGYSFADHFLDVTGVGTGTLTITTTYAVGASANTSALSGMLFWADSWAYAGLDIADDTGWLQQVSLGASLHDYNGTVSDYSDPFSGTIQVSVAVSAGRSYEVQARTITSQLVNATPVPEPDSLTLAACGLWSMAALMARRTRHRLTCAGRASAAN